MAACILLLVDHCLHYTGYLWSDEVKVQWEVYSALVQYKLYIPETVKQYVVSVTTSKICYNYQKRRVSFVVDNYVRHPLMFCLLVSNIAKYILLLIFPRSLYIR